MAKGKQPAKLRQGIKISGESGDVTSSHLDQSALDDHIPIDPSLVDLVDRAQQVARGGGGEDVSGKISQSRSQQDTVVDEQQNLAHHGPVSTGAVEDAITDSTPITAAGGGGGGGGAGGGMDEDLDPDWREIVNSLNQASQSNDIHHRDALHPSETNSHEASHLAEHEERDRIEQSLQNTLEHFTEANLSDLFPGNFGQSPPAHFDLSTGEASQPIASSSSITHTIPSSGLAGDSSTIDAPPFEVSVKRGRGRPKGSKNKYKAVTKPRKPRRKKTPPPKRPRGRPPKVRDPDEQAEYEASRARKELGIAKRKGRPRKFPGYLVREMRLRKNREEYIRLLREYEENHPEGQEPPEDPDGGVDDDIRMEVVPTMDEGYQAEDEVRRALEGQAFNLAASGMDGQPSGDVQPDVSGEGGVESIFANAWEPHGQSLLEVVDAAAAAEAARRAEEEEEEQEPVEGEENMPSGHDSQAVEDMKRVFRLDGGDGEEGIDMGMGLGEV